jgi:hypothetical protein
MRRRGKDAAQGWHFGIRKNPERVEHETRAAHSFFLIQLCF